MCIIYLLIYIFKFFFVCVSTYRGVDSCVCVIVFHFICQVRFGGRGLCFIHVNQSCDLGMYVGV